MSFSCGINDAGAGYCWGDNSVGQLGSNSTLSSNRPVPVHGDRTFVAITAGATHACALVDDGTAYCWGNGTYGQLGDDLGASSLVPVAVSGGLHFTSFSSDSTGYHTCALSDSGAVYCWGAGSASQIGDGGYSHRYVPTLVAGSHTYAAVGVGIEHSCAVTTSGAAFCWGSNFYNQIGPSGLGTFVLTPTRVAAGLVLRAIDGGRHHTCALDIAGRSHCWGAGYLGNGTTTPSPTPVAVIGGHVFNAIHVGYDAACGVTTKNQGFCWGSNSVGQLGLGPQPPPGSTSPVEVLGNMVFASIRVGAWHGCGTNLRGQVYCWGVSGAGQLGDGVADGYVHPPVLVIEP